MNQLLFHLELPDIKITVEAYFLDDKLVIEGYDIGKKVEDAWGDSDYEYSMVLPAESVQQVYKLFNVPAGSKEELLKAIAAKYNGNHCYSQLMDLFTQHNIEFEPDSWT